MHLAARYGHRCLASTFPGRSVSLNVPYEGATLFDFRRPDKSSPSSILITVEHASNALPDPYTFDGQMLDGTSSGALVDSHWAWDPGALDSAKTLAQGIGGVVVAAPYSRLLIDPNRPLASDTLIRQYCGDETVAMNAKVDAEETKARVDRFYSPFHLALGAVKAQVWKGAFLALLDR